MNIGVTSLIALITGALVGVNVAFALVAMDRQPINVNLDVAPVTQAGDKLACLPILKPAK